MEVIPGILEKDWTEIERKINIAKKFARNLHLDIIDGKFASNTTFLDPAPFAKYSKEVNFEVHMMVEEPINFLKPFADAGFRRFIGHVEKMSDQVEFVARAQLLGEVGLAIDSPTPVDKIEVPLDDLDFVTIMTVKAGLSGQEFITDCLKKVEVFLPDRSPAPDGAGRSLRAGNDIIIEVDGGVNDKTIVEAMKAGVNRFVATSFLFGSEDPQKQYELLASCLQR